ncbi:CPBP family intramembrane glutamic endopeptidase [Clostridium cellulovorans]|uniref:CPBP family glutamic-type intramembrane protease n=1 Tax=Clostridium cellulovorans TaxID=1493 RepID=UPI0018DECF59
MYLSTGLFEEVLCRGVILTVMLRKWGNSKVGIYLSVITSSLIFGTAHIANFLSNRSLLLATVTQITFAFFIGVFFATCFLRNKTI